MQTDDPGKAIADRMTLEKVAKSYRELMELQDKQRVTQAQLIRWAMQAIDKPRPVLVWGNPARGDHGAAVGKWKKDQLLAREGLLWLAAKLEGTDVPDFMPTK